MSVHPVCQKMLDALAEMPELAPGTDVIKAMRENAENRTVMKLGPETPMDIVENKTIMVRDGHEVPVRIYTPPNYVTPEPAIVFFHGGAWISGSLRTHETTCQHLAIDTGLKVLSVDYRLAPEHRFPIGANDCCDVTEWASMCAGELGIDPARLIVAGDSAGGNLAAVVALWARDYDGPKIAFQLLIYPVIDSVTISASRSQFATGYFLEQTGMNWCTEQYVNEEAERSMWQVSPIYAESLAGLPPAHVITAGYDILKDEGKAYAEALAAAGVATTYVDYGDVIHGFFGFGSALDRAREASLRAAEEIKKVVG